MIDFESICFKMLANVIVVPGKSAGPAGQRG